MKLSIFCLITIFVLALNAFPNYYASLKTPAGTSYSGQASWFDPWDVNVYTAAIKWGQGGNILLQNMYTTAPHTLSLMYPLYTLTGYLFPKVSPYLAFHILAIIFGFLLLITLWKLGGVYIQNVTERLLAIFLIAVGGGVGWLFFPQFQSVDLFITGFTFTSHFQRAHEALAVILYLVSLTTFYLGANQMRFLLNLISLTSLLALIIFYPYYLISYIFICGFYSLVLLLKKSNQKPLFYLLINVVITLPLLLLYLNHLRESSGFEGVISQTLVTPGLLQIFSGYGILSILILYQLRLSNKDRRWAFLNIWFFGSIALSFLPFGFARFYLRTLFFPAVVLALLSFEQLSSKLHLSRKFLIATLIVTLPISSFFMTYKRLAEVENNNHWYYLTSAEREALNFFQTQTPPGSGVLSAYTLGNYIPANTDNRVYFGHLLQTPDSQEKINRLIRFYSNNLAEDEANLFLKNENINYIFHGSEEQKIASTSNEKLKYSSLKSVYSNDTVIIYRFDGK